MDGDLEDDTCSIVNSQQTDDFVENIKIYLRIRPFVEREDFCGEARRPSILQMNPDGHPIVSIINKGAVSETFEYDYVGGPETRQADVFEAVAKPITENCLQGYNGTIFAYGQTGSGKTFTMQGPQFLDGQSMAEQEDRGLILRTFEYLFARISQEQASHGTVFECKCSYIEIYNEAIYDLLDSYGRVCGLREDTKKGNRVYVEDCTMAKISDPLEAYQIFAEGARNRHVASTSMNRESSRSHSVFTLFITSKAAVGEVVDVREARFNLVDLAGSERQQLTGTVGLRLKEAGNINKSLLALSNVINALVETAGGRPRHVHYRDSKLTFLLRDSLGGNAKTCIVANVSPSPFCLAETISTLRFAQRAKMIRNQAIVNKDIQGNMAQLQAEIKRLQSELVAARAASSISIDRRISNMSVSGHDLGTQQQHQLGTEDAAALKLARQRQIDLSNELIKLKESLEDAQELIRRKEYTIQATRMIVRLRENTISALKEEKPEGVLIDEEIERLVEENALLKEQLAFGSPNEIRLAMEYAKLKERFEALDGLTVEDFDRLSYQLQHQQSHIDMMTRKILALENDGNSNTCEEENDAKRLRIEPKMLELETIVTSQRQELEGLQRHLSLLSEERVHINGQYEAATASVGQLQEQLANANASKEASDHRIKDLEAHLHQLSSQKELLSVELDAKQNQLSSLEAVLQDSLRKIERLEVTLEATKSQARQDYESLVERHASEIAKLTSSHSQQVDNLKKMNQAALESLKTTFESEREQANQAQQSEIDRLKANLAKVEAFLSETQLNLGSLASESEALRAQNRTLLRQIEQEKASAANQLQMATSASKSAHQENMMIQVELASLRKAAADLEVIRKELEKSIEESKRKDQKIEELSTKLVQSPPKPRIDEVLHKKLQADNQQYLQKINKLEYLLRNAEETNNHFMNELEQRPDQAEMDKLRSDLEMVTKERDSLKSLTCQLEEENVDLAEHTNKNQRIMVLAKIKEENNGLKESIMKCQRELCKEKERSERLQTSILKTKKLVSEITDPEIARKMSILLSSDAVDLTTAST